MTTMAKAIRDAKVKDHASVLLSSMVDRKVENRCAICNCLFFLGRIGEGTVIEVKCSRCGEMICFGRQHE